ncbi:SDR family NAD(P)-dependent oxidoreductase [Hamadaea tsunoensis]|uniref:SDR family NAD(P)-dependent oxidoreductase n=1 Tax=Hamadaea tsunoensis TaxID=53368 RepID=UPI0005562FB1|nr:SDR family oxidoreductase [Hamadaea tsunoensis]
MTRRVCLLTGASGTFGQAFVRRCAADYQIVAAHHTTPIEYATQDQSFVDPLRPEAGVAENEDAVYSIAADLLAPDGPARVVAETIRAFGRIDMLVNAAARRDWGPLTAPESLDALPDLFALNVFVPVRLAAEAADAYWRRDPADNARELRHVVNLSSTAGHYVYPDLGQGVYSASKAALTQLTYHQASEFWNLGVRVNAVAPNTFPGIVGVDDVIDAVLAFDKSEETGTITVLVGPS